MEGSLLHSFLGNYLLFTLLALYTLYCGTHTAKVERDLPGPNRSLLPAVSRLENESSDNNPPFSPSFFQKGTSTEKKKET